MKSAHQTTNSVGVKMPINVYLSTDETQISDQYKN